MLAALERKLIATIADGLTARPHLRVVGAPDPGLPEQPGEDRVRVVVAELTPQAGFAPARLALAGEESAPRSRRVLPVRFTARIAFRLRPPGDPGPDPAAGRALLLDDVSFIAHLLGADEVRGGRAFAVADPDPGFLVRAFDFAGGRLDDAPLDGLLGGELRYAGEAEVWPPGVLAEEHPIRIDVVLQTQPIAIVPDRPALPPGEATTVRVRAAAGTRLSPDGTGREPLALAVTVLGDVPPAERGAITSGEAGAATGFRIVPVTGNETALTYQAPAADPGAERLEYVAVHLATPERRPGLFLGSAPVRLLPGGP